MAKIGYIILEDGTQLAGTSFGYDAQVTGEVVFNTGMVGYPEGFTDPSYAGQILVTTYPLIGNYGVPEPAKTNGLLDNFESDRIQIRGLVVSTYIANNTHWQASQTLSSWLKSEKIPALFGIDTRSLTKRLREKGVAKGVITFSQPVRGEKYNFEDINSTNLVSLVSPTELTSYGNGPIKVILMDCGVKFSIIRNLTAAGCTVIRVPWDFDPFSTKPPADFDAVVISNGPGDPKMADKTIEITKEALKRRVPLFGICLGNQILALAAGANTYKLKYGHRGQNQPVKDLLSGKCFVTSQNHGFAVDTKTLPDGWLPWFENLNDGTNEGIVHKNLPFLTVQFHPEATPGPTDATYLFDHFVKVIKKWKKRE